MVRPSAAQELVAIFEEAKALATRAGNDFAWSSWEDEKEASAELGRIIAAIGRGELLPRAELEVIFAVSGPLQELAVSSGWATAFGDLARRFDAAAERIYPRSGTQLPES